MKIFNILDCLCSWAGWLESNLGCEPSRVYRVRVYDYILTFQSRRKSEPKSDEKSVEKPPQINRENTPIPIGKRTGAELSRRVAEIQIFEKTYLIVIKDETGLKFKMNDSTLFLIGSYAQKLVASY